MCNQDKGCKALIKSAVGNFPLKRAVNRFFLCKKTYLSYILHANSLNFG